MRGWLVAIGVGLGTLAVLVVVVVVGTSARPQRLRCEELYINDDNWPIPHVLVERDEDTLRLELVPLRQDGEIVREGRFMTQTGVSSFRCVESQPAP